MEKAPGLGPAEPGPKKTCARSSLNVANMIDVDSSYETLSVVARSWCHETLSTSDTWVFSPYFYNRDRKRGHLVWFGY